MSNKIKVMHVLTSNSFSGAENVVIKIISNTRDKVDSIYVSSDGPIRDVLAENGIGYYFFKKLTIGNLLKAIKDNRPDVIHAHDFKAGVVSALLTRSISIISHLHNNPPWAKKISIKSVAYGILAIRYKKILTVSDAVMDEFIFGRYYKKKTNVIGNPIDLNEIRQKTRTALENEQSDVAFLGRLTKPKNPFAFVEIINELKKKNPSIYAVMIGNGELRKGVERRILDLGLEHNIRLYGFQKNPYGLLRHTKILCMPSLWEGFGLAAVEAMALGKPVVCSGVGGLKNIVTEGTGKCCKEISEYVEEIEKLLSDKAYYTAISEAVLNRADNLDNLNTYINEISKEYLNCVMKKDRQ